jgi:hypothetical protein
LYEFAYLFELIGFFFVVRGIFGDAREIDGLDLFRSIVVSGLEWILLYNIGSRVYPSAIPIVGMNDGLGIPEWIPDFDIYEYPYKDKHQSNRVIVWMNRREYFPYTYDNILAIR